MQIIKDFNNLARVCAVEPTHLLAILKNIDSYYYMKEEPKKDRQTGKIKLDENGKAKMRKIFPSKGRLKLVQKNLELYFKTFHFPPYIMGGIKKRDNVKCVNTHKGNKFHFLTDIESFFPSITSEMVRFTLEKTGFPRYVAEYITKLFTYKGFVPQGAPTSTFMANLVFFVNADKRIKGFCEKKGLTYTRFVDDLWFSSDYCFKKIATI